LNRALKKGEYATCLPRKGKKICRKEPIGNVRVKCPEKGHIGMDAEYSRGNWVNNYYEDDNTK
jgi:hypothetical protein